MKKPTRDEVLGVLRERSTIAGLAGLTVAVASLFGQHVDEVVISELMLVLISIVAIVTRPDKHAGHSDSHGSRPAGVDPGADLRPAEGAGEGDDDAGKDRPTESRQRPADKSGGGA